MRILLIEDQRELAAVLADGLKDSGFAVDTVRTIREACEATVLAAYDMILIDRKLPDGDGLDFLRKQRRLGSSTAAIVITATMPDVDDRVEGLNAGADDYVLKPVLIDELVARIRAVLRRPARSLAPVLQAGNVELDLTTRQVFVAGSRIHVPRREVGLIELLMRRFGRVVAKAALEESLYSFDEEVSPNAIEVAVYRLRTYLAKSGATVTIRTVRGTGYVLEEDVRSAEGAGPADHALQFAVSVGVRDRE
jgi:DNA-binding response OmpR family regulator